MGKSTDVHDLLVIYQNQHRKIPAKGVYASKQRQSEVNAARVRKLMRKRRRSVGKSNKLGFRFTAEMWVESICDMNFYALICRSSHQQPPNNDFSALSATRLHVQGVIGNEQ